MRYKKLIVGSNSDNIAKKNFIWNMMGSSIYAFASVILLMSVTREIGEEAGGVFSIAFTTGQLMLTICYYEMRPYQVTDINDEFEFKDYYTVRLITSSLMIICSILYIIVSGYTFKKAIIVLFICLYKMIDGVADVFEGMFQKEGRLDIAGKSVAFRSIFTTSVFIILVTVTKDLIISSFLTFLSAILGIIIFDIAIIEDFAKIEISRNFNPIKRLLKECFPYFICSFMNIYIFNAVKYAIDGSMDERFQTYFSIIFMPTYTINLLSGFILKPLLTTFAENWRARKLKKFKSTVVKLIIYILIITLVVVIGGYLLGIPILSWLYGVDISFYKRELILLLIGGGIAAISLALYYVLTVMRKTKSIFIAYTLTFIFTFISSRIFVMKLGIYGGAISYILSMIIMVLCFTIFTYINYKKHKNDKIIEK